jgi:hypothetical protein
VTQFQANGFKLRGDGRSWRLTKEDRKRPANMSRAVWKKLKRAKKHEQDSA